MTDHAIEAHPEQALAPQDNDGIGLGAGIAIGAHVALVVALWFGVHWNVGQPTVMSAELWSSVPREAAPKAVAPPPPPPEPEVQKTAPPPQPVQPPPQEQQAQRDAQIAIEQAREKRKRDEAEQRLLAQRELEKQKAEAAKQAADEKAAKAKAARDKALADEAAKAKAKAEADAKKAAKAKAKPQASDDDDQFARELNKRLKAKNGPHSAEDGSGSALHASAPSTGYAGRLMARIKPNIHYAGLYDNIKAVVDLRVSPDGRIISSKLVQSSGVASWDDAVMKAIDLTEVLPADIDGRVPGYIELTFNPQDK